MGEREQTVRQTTILLPYFDSEISVLAADDALSISVIALCEMMGLRMFCGMWTVCYSTWEIETSLHLLPGQFL